jgi:hypothetical protein
MQKQQQQQQQQLQLQDRDILLHCGHMCMLTITAVRTHSYVRTHSCVRISQLRLLVLPVLS